MNKYGFFMNPDDLCVAKSDLMTAIIEVVVSFPAHYKYIYT